MTPVYIARRGKQMIELKRKVKKEVEETYKVELVAYWTVRVLRPNGNRTHFCIYEESFAFEPKEEEIASILLNHATREDEYVSIYENYKLVEVSE